MRQTNPDSNACYKYLQQLALCMLTYQYIECGLKFCLIRCHAAIQYRLDGYLLYEMPFESIEQAALGRLIQQYKTYTSSSSVDSVSNAL